MLVFFRHIKNKMIILYNLAGLALRVWLSAKKHCIISDQLLADSTAFYNWWNFGDVIMAGKC